MSSSERPRLSYINFRARINFPVLETPPFINLRRNAEPKFLWTLVLFLYIRYDW